MANPLNSSELIFPTLEVLHITGFAIMVGTVSVVDFRLLGLGLTSQSASDIAKALLRWTILGVILVFTSGPLLYSSDPDMYYLNHWFQLKMVLLVGAVWLQYIIHIKTVNDEFTPSGAKRAAALALLMWIGIFAGGIFIAFS